MMQGESLHPRYSENTGVRIHHYSESSKDQNTHLFNSIDRLSADHNVTVSSTMIKVTYNKEVKDHPEVPIFRSEIENKRHSVTLKSSFPYKLSSNPSDNKKYNKDFLNQVLIPSCVTMANGKETEMNTNLESTVREEYSAGINEQNHYIPISNKLFTKSVDEMRKSDLNNHIQHSNQAQMKQLKVCLTKLNVMEPRESSTSPVLMNNMREDYLNHKNISSEIETKLKKSDNFKDSNETKDFNLGDVVCGEGEKIVAASNAVDKNGLKPSKSKEKHFKRKRSSSREVFNETKKVKNDANISDKNMFENLSTPKVKDANKREKQLPDKSTSNEKEGFRKEILQHDPTLPNGWKRIIRGKHTGNYFKPVVCIVSPEGRKFYFKAKLKSYLERTNSSLTIDDFHFGLYPRQDKVICSIEQDKKMDKEKDGSSEIEKGKKKKQFDFLKNEDLGDKTKKLILSSKEKFLLYDPDLPPGWDRRIRLRKDGDNSHKFQVCVLSPEGKKFKRKYLLHKYLNKTRSPLDINQFYFGLYSKMDSERTGQATKESINKQKIRSSESEAETQKSTKSKEGGPCNSIGDKRLSLVLTKIDDDEYMRHEQPLVNDTNLPSGWRRYIRVRSTGESAGRIEVVIVSPEGRRFRSRGSLDNYIRHKGLDYNVDDFDFSIFGKHSKGLGSSSQTPTPARQIRKRNSVITPTEKVIPNLNFSTSTPTNEVNKTTEALMINYVSGLMLSCGLSDLRTERRPRIPRDEHERLVKASFDSEGIKSLGDNEISSGWVQKLITCRSEMVTLDVEAATTIACLTKEFLQALSRQALAVSSTETRLEYGDVAELVDRSECLSPLKTLIPKKISFREFAKLNRPTKFTSFT